MLELVDSQALINPCFPCQTDNCKWKNNQWYFLMLSPSLGVDEETIVNEETLSQWEEKGRHS